MIDLNKDNDFKAFYLSEISLKSQYLYWFLLLMVLVVFLILPLVKVDISIKSNGIVRPIQERSEIKAPVSAIIDSVYFKEGEKTKKGDVIFRFRNDNASVQYALQNNEINQRLKYLNDLAILCSGKEITLISFNQLHTILYQQQLERVKNQLAAQKASLLKAEREYADNVKLKAEKIISDYEFLDKLTEYERQKAQYQSAENEQKSQWAEQFVQYQLEVANFRSQQVQLNNSNMVYDVKAPLSGTLQGINIRYAGNTVQIGETLCTLSPDVTIVGECYMPSQDVGLIKVGQRVLFQIDAFDYNYFGIVTGKVASIDNDFTIHEGKPFFKVRCTFDTTKVYLKNGFSGNLKKGMTFQSRLIVARRSLWQLLFDNLDDWLNPTAPDKS